MKRVNLVLSLMVVLVGAEKLTHATVLGGTPSGGVWQSALQNVDLLLDNSNNFSADIDFLFEGMRHLQIFSDGSITETLGVSVVGEVLGTTGGTIITPIGRSLLDEFGDVLPGATTPGGPNNTSFPIGVLSFSHSSGVDLVEPGENLIFHGVRVSFRVQPSPEITSVSIDTIRLLIGGDRLVEGVWGEVPEPITATLGLMGLGVLGMATRRRVA